ncbi:RNA polymerase-associated protein LEO1 [Echinococcus granulosus]|nr:RNA polymerase-associated protein LEO1 [Echinococcus granulosus]
MSDVSSPSGSLSSSNGMRSQSKSSEGSVSAHSHVNHRDIFGSDTEVVSPARNQKTMDVSSDDSEENTYAKVSSSNLHNTAVSTRDILGSSSSEPESEDDVPLENNKVRSPPTSSDDSIWGSSKKRGFANEVEDLNGREQDGHQEPVIEEEESDEIRIAADFPPIRADLGREMYLVKMPNFLSVETRPFDPAFYEGELDEDEVLDEEGRTRLKLKVENTIRWRLGKNANNEVIQESNARMVRWSDGSLSLHLGDEIFDVHKMDIQSDFNHLFIREDRGLQGQSIFRSKLSFRPHSTDSFTHRKMTLSLADKTSKSQKVKILPVAGADPESNRSLAVRKEEERLRVALRRESQQRRMQERQLAAASAHRQRRPAPGPSGYESFGDSDADIAGNSVSLSAIKRNARAGFLSSQKNRGRSVSDSDDASMSDLSDAPRRKKARISDEDDSG